MGEEVEETDETTGTRGDKREEANPANLAERRAILRPAEDTRGDKKAAINISTND